MQASEYIKPVSVHFKISIPTTQAYPTDNDSPVVVSKKIVQQIRFTCFRT